jgi:hypothetical protein
MRTSEVKKVLPTFVKAKVPVMLWGSPGIGKSDIVFSLGLPVIDLRLSQIDAVDLRGLPRVENDQTSWCPPNFLPTEGEGILFLDEINQADKTVQAAAYQLILNRRIGDYKLPDGWTIIAAGNRLTDGALANPLSSALKNRMAHIDVECAAEDWYDWAYANDINEMIIAFLKFRPDLLNTFDPTKRDVASFATPRSWSFLSRLLEHATHDMIFSLACSTVGEAAAVEFDAYVNVYKNLPSYEDVRDNPEKTEVPTELALLYAITTMLVNRTEKKDFSKVFKFIEKLPVEFQTMFFKDISKKNAEIVLTAEFTKWSKQNAAVLF